MRTHTENLCCSAGGKEEEEEEEEEEEKEFGVGMQRKWTEGGGGEYRECHKYNDLQLSGKEEKNLEKILDVLRESVLICMLIFWHTLCYLRTTYVLQWVS